MYTSQMPLVNPPSGEVIKGRLATLKGLHGLNSSCDKDALRRATRSFTIGAKIG